MPWHLIPHAWLSKLIFRGFSSSCVLALCCRHTVQVWATNLELCPVLTPLECHSTLLSTLPRPPTTPKIDYNHKHSMNFIATPFPHAQECNEYHLYNRNKAPSANQSPLPCTTLQISPSPVLHHPCKHTQSVLAAKTHSHLLQTCPCVPQQPQWGHGCMYTGISTSAPIHTCIQVLVPLHLYTLCIQVLVPLHLYTHIDCCMLQSPSVHTNAHYYYFLCGLYSTNFYVALQISSTNVPFVGNICAIKSKISRWEIVDGANLRKCKH